MLRYLRAASAFSAALLLGTFLGASSPVASARADALSGVTGPAAHAVSEAPPPPDDPKRKKEGEACKSSDECQRHHTCAKVGDTSVCKAPPRRVLPPGAVT